MEDALGLVATDWFKLRRLDNTGDNSASLIDHKISSFFTAPGLFS